MSNIYKKGENIFLYAKFCNENMQSISVQNPMVKIIYEKNNSIVNLLNWQDMSSLGQVGEYFYNFLLPYNCDYSSYEIVYIGESDGKVLRIVESFHIIPTSEIYDNAVKVYGIVNDSKIGYQLSSVSITISRTFQNEVVSQTQTKENGVWETFLYPGEYIFSFKRLGFEPEEIVAQISDQLSEIQFNNVTLHNEKFNSNGNGSFTISDKLVTKEGVPLNGLSVKLYNCLNPNVIIAQDVTSDVGEYNLFIDEGTYLLKISGESLHENFNQIFRLKISQNGESSFENLSENIGMPIQNEIGKGSGSIKVEDTIIDNNGNPIVDVQVSAYKINNLDLIVGQDYTGPNGKWELFLDEGTYRIEFYHPNFHEIFEERSIS